MRCRAPGVLWAPGTAGCRYQAEAGCSCLPRAGGEGRLLCSFKPSDCKVSFPLLQNEYMKEDFLIKIETWHKPDLGTLENVSSTSQAPRGLPGLRTGY